MSTIEGLFLFVMLSVQNLALFFLIIEQVTEISDNLEVKLEQYHTLLSIKFDHFEDKFKVPKPVFTNEDPQFIEEFINNTKTDTN